MKSPGSEFPLEIWADWLEDQGQDTEALRFWLALGLSSCGLGFNYAFGQESNYGDGFLAAHLAGGGGYAVYYEPEPWVRGTIQLWGGVLGYGMGS